MLKPYQKRVLEEKKHLDGNIVKLTNFIEESDDYDEVSGEEQNRLSDQLAVMKRYSEILFERIEYFKQTKS